MSINFADVKVGESSKFSVIEEGRYITLIEDAVTGVSKNGNDKLSLTLKVLGNDKYKNRKLWADLTITEKSLPFFKEFLVSVNSSLAEASSVELEDIAADVKNKKCSIYTSIESYGDSGKTRNKVSVFRPLSEDELEILKNSNVETSAPDTKMFV